MIRLASGFVEKLVYVIWDRPSIDRTELRQRYLGEVAPKLTEAGVTGLELHLDDDHATLDGPAPCPASELSYRAVVSLWLDAHDHRGEIEDLLVGLGVRTAGYLVTESTIAASAPGSDSHRHDRTTTSGERSAGISTVALVRRNPVLDARTFRELWYGHQSVMSGEVQPRLHYTRNTVVHGITPGAPPYDGIVIECWPDADVVADPIAFHGGPEVGEENLVVMLDSVTQLFDMGPLRSVAMSEYLLEA